MEAKTMAEFGVSNEGFNLKGFDVILNEGLERARQMFGSAIALTTTSPLRKLLEVTAAEDAELWKRMEDVYYSNFVSTAVGDNLDLLGEDVGLTRHQLFGSGEVTIKISAAVPGRRYVLPEGTMLVTTAPMHSFYTKAPVTLSAVSPSVSVAVRAYARGPDSNIQANTVIGIDPVYKQIYLGNFGVALLSVENAKSFTGGEAFESDDDFRQRLLGLPRNLWTLESIRRAVLDVHGVTDVLLFDPLGGVDVSQSYFNLFSFNQRLFSSERSVGEAYFFDIVVAHEFAWPWRTTGNVPGIFEQVTAAVERVRPIGIYPNVVEANHIDIGIRAKVIVRGGYDEHALLASIRQRLASDIGALKLGGDVLYSQVIGAFVEQPGVVDVQQVRLRRCPPAFGRIRFGSVPHQTELIEAAVGENLEMGATEQAVFHADGDLIEFEVVTQ
jgi:hypothetical protein